MDPDPDPDPHWFWSPGSGSGSRQAKMTRKRRKKGRNVWFWSAGCPLLRGEDLSFSMDVLHGGLRINIKQFLINKICIFFQLKIFSIFGHQNPGSGSGSGSALTWNAESGSGSALKPMRIHNTDFFLVAHCLIFSHGSLPDQNKTLSRLVRTFLQITRSYKGNQKLPSKLPVPKLEFFNT